MSSSSIVGSAGPRYGGAAQRPYRIASGIALSLALHALLLFAYRNGALQHAAPDNRPAAQSLTVWLRAPAPPLAPPPAVVPPVPRRAGATQPRARPSATPGPAPVPSAVLVAAPSARPVTVLVAPALEAAPHFDMDAARGQARKLAGTPDPALAGTARGQIDAHPLFAEQTETKVARDIEKSRRRLCKDGIPGGIFAPLVLLMDKKDSGCKW